MEGNVCLPVCVSILCLSVYFFPEREKEKAGVAKKGVIKLSEEVRQRGISKEGVGEKRLRKCRGNYSETKGIRRQMYKKGNGGVKENGRGQEGCSRYNIL